MSDSLQSLAEDFHSHAVRDVNARLIAGLSDNLGSLPDPSLEAAEAQRLSAEKLLDRSLLLKKDDFSFDQKLDLELLQLMLRSEVHQLSYTFNEKSTLQQMPKAGDSIGDGIFLLFINDPRSALERIADIHGRLKATPSFLKAMLNRLDTPIARWVSMDLETVEGLPQLFATVEAWAKESGYKDFDSFQTDRENAELALKEYSASLAKLPTSTELHVGTETAAQIIKLRGIEKSMEELHAIAANFLKTTAAQIEGLRSKLVKKYELPADTSAAYLQKHLAEKYRVELPNGKVEDILDIYHSEREKILAFIKERDLFPVFDDQDMKIMRTPAFMAPSIPAGAMMPPPSFREGTRTSMVYLTLSEELVDEHTELSIPAMMIHEGIPGHHLQLATASKHESIIRRHVDANDHAEGWTTMLEDYMLDVGYKADLADEVRFCGKRDLSRIGARVAIDLFFMSGDKKYLDVGVDCDISSDDPFIAAGELLQAVTGFVPGRVQAELNWYSQERGYPLSYLTGNHLVWEIKDDLAKAQAGKLEGVELDKKLHDLYLHSGCMPVSYFRKVLKNEGLLS